MPEQLVIRPSPLGRRNDSLRERFVNFHRDNPQVYELLVRFARQAKAAGRERIGIRMLWERMRWEIMLQTIEPDGRKLNDRLTSRYARLIMASEPDLAEMFETRRLRST